MNLDQLRADKAQRWARACEIMAAAQAEDRAMNEAEAAQYGEHLAAMDALDARISQLEEHERNSRRNGAPVDSDVRRRVIGGAGQDDDGDEARAEYGRVFDRYLRFGLGELDPAERRALRAGFRANREGADESRALASGTGTAGGYLIPATFMSKVVEARKWFGGVRAAVAAGSPGGILQTDNGEAITWPTNDDTAQKGERLAENAAANQQDVTFGQVMLNAYIYSSKMVLVPNTLLEDSAVDIEMFLANVFNNRLGRIRNQEYTTGTGNAMPQGVAVGASTGKTTASATAIAFTELIDLEHSIDIAYRNPDTNVYMMHDTVLAYIRKLVDTTGRPLWQPGLEKGAPNTLNNYRYIVNNDMDSAVTSGKTTVLFGDFGLYYKIREVNGVAVLRLSERYAEYAQTAFLAFERADGKVVDALAVKKLLQA